MPTEKVVVGYRVVDTNTGKYVERWRGLAGQDVGLRGNLRNTERRPLAMARKDALRLLADWLDCGYLGHIVKVTRTPRAPRFDARVRLRGKRAFLRDIACLPGQVGACTILGPSTKGPLWVVVEWDKDGNHHEAGDVSVEKLSLLDVRT